MSHERISGLIYLGVMFLTAGVLFLLGFQTWVVWVVGAGAGFIAMAIVRAYERRKGSGIIFAGFLLLFGGLGHLLGLGTTGWIIGLGIGFIAMAIYTVRRRVLAL